MSVIAEAVNVSKTFDVTPPLTPLREVSLQVSAGQMIAITGVSGQGKSTLLNVLGGILRPDTGTVTYKGNNIHTLSSNERNCIYQQGIGFVFQSPYLFQALTVKENLLFSQKARNKPVDERRVLSLLEEFGLEEHAEHLPYELSVGQKRRLVIASTLLADHTLILSDEPTNDLDAAWSEYVYKCFREFSNSEERAVIFVTHDVEYARRADRLFKLKDGLLETLA